MLLMVLCSFTCNQHICIITVSVTKWKILQDFIYERLKGSIGMSKWHTKELK